MKRFILTLLLVFCASSSMAAIITLDEDVDTTLGGAYGDDLRLTLFGNWANQNLVNIEVYAKNATQDSAIAANTIPTLTDGQIIEGASDGTPIAVTPVEILPGNGIDITAGVISSNIIGTTMIDTLPATLVEGVRYFARDTRLETYSDSSGVYTSPTAWTYASSATAILTFGDMETTGSWTNYASTSTFETTIFHGGSRSLKVVDSGSIAATSTPITTAIGTSYTLSGWVRSDSGNAGSEYGRIAASTIGTNNNTYYLTTNDGAIEGAANDDTWYFFSLNFTATSTTTYILCAPSIATGDITYFDDMTVVEL